MKLFRRLSALVMALVLVLSLSIGVLAADFDNMYDGFNYDGEDTEVNINLSTDDGGRTYETKEGKTYTINSDNGSEMFWSNFIGSGEVVVNVDSNDIRVWDSVTATINGNIDEHLSASGESEVTVTGDVAAISAYEQATITITGNAGGAYASDQAEITINGNAGGLAADGQGQITANGDSGGIYAEAQAEIIVNGNATGTSGESDIDLDDSWDYSYGDDGIWACGDSTVTVTGNVTGGDGYGTMGDGGDGINAYDNAKITVGGDVTGGNVIANPNTEKANSSYAGNGVYLSGSASVSIGGNITGGNTNAAGGYAGNGALVNSHSSKEPVCVLTVGGTATAGKAENGIDGIGIDIELLDDTNLPSVTVYDYDTADGLIYTYDDNGEFRENVRNLTQEELDEIITVTGRETDSEGEGPEKVPAEPYYGSVFHYSRGQLINEYGVCVRALFDFGSDWEETVESGTATITSAEKQGRILVTVGSLKAMMNVGIETIVFNGTKLVLKDAVAERTAYDTYTITASGILLNGASI